MVIWSLDTAAKTQYLKYSQSRRSSHLSESINNAESVTIAQDESQENKENGALDHQQDEESFQEITGVRQSNDRKPQNNEGNQDESQCVNVSLVKNRSRRLIMKRKSLLQRIKQDPSLLMIGFACGSQSIYSPQVLFYN